MTINSHDDSHRFQVKLTPNASRNEITDFTNGVLHVKIAALPVKGKANRELIAFLSRTLGVMKSSISIVKGQTSRNKVITIDSISLNDIIQRLSP